MCNNGASLVVVFSVQGETEISVSRDSDIIGPCILNFDILTLWHWHWHCEWHCDNQKVTNKQVTNQQVIIKKWQSKSDNQKVTIKKWQSKSDNP